MIRRWKRKKTRLFVVIKLTVRLLQVNDFDCHLLRRLFVNGAVHLPKTALSDSFLQFEQFSRIFSHFFLDNFSHWNWTSQSAEKTMIESSLCWMSHRKLRKIKKDVKRENFFSFGAVFSSENKSQSLNKKLWLWSGLQPRMTSDNRLENRVERFFICKKSLYDCV